MRPPYLQVLGRFDNVECHLVDGQIIRDEQDVEFTNGAHHYTRPYIPESEVWIDREAPGADELRFLIHHQLDERRLMQGGASYEVALRHASHRERLARRAELGRHRHLAAAAARDRVRRQLLDQIDGDAVWLVAGRGVRDHFHPDFTLGGHGLRYRFIPRREIWIDDAVLDRERPAILLHEVAELRLMRAGITYAEAHRRASQRERRFRRRR